MVARYRVSFPDLGETGVEQFVGMQIEYKRSERAQWLDQFREPITAETVSIVLASHALSEASINFALAFGLHFVNEPGNFPKVEKQSLERKWRTEPNKFIKPYALSPNLDGRLKRLHQRRISFAHSKVHMADGSGNVIIQGTAQHGLQLGPEAIAELRDFLVLPYDLMLNLLSHEVDIGLRARLGSILLHPPESHAIQLREAVLRRPIVGEGLRAP